MTMEQRESDAAGTQRKELAELHAEHERQKTLGDAQKRFQLMARSLLDNAHDPELLVRGTAALRPLAIEAVERI